MVRTTSSSIQSAPGVSIDPAPERRVPAVAYWLSGGLAALLVFASAAGLFVPGLYHDTPDWVAQTRATDLVTLALAVPALVAALFLAARGSLRARIVWLGVLGYALYMYAIYAFAVAFNGLFLVYVAVLALSAWSLVALLTRLDPDDARPRSEPSLIVQAVALYLLVVAALFFLTWMRDIVPALVNHTAPASLAKTRQPTNPVEVLDLSLLLPLAVLTGLWLWRRRPWGYLLAGVTLTTMTLVGASVVVDMAFERAADPTVSLAMAPPFAVITLVGLALLVVYLRNLHGPGAVRVARPPRVRRERLR